ncbi:MAG: adenylate/guanylate cyclase domain-containing protein [Verrucomicrobiota bacterium]
MNWKRKKWINAMLCTAATLLWLTIYALSYFTASETFYSPLLKLENISEDFRVRYGRQAVVDERLVFIGIDKQIYTEEVWPEEIAESEALQLITAKSYPWSRKIWGLLAERLIENGAELIILDLIFPHESEGDDYFRQVVEQNRDRILLGANLNRRQMHNEEGALDLQIIRPVDSITGDPTAGRTHTGLVNFWEDRDGITRRLNFNFALRGEKIPTFVTQAARMTGSENPWLDSAYSYRFRFVGPPQSVFKIRPIYEIFAPVMWQSNYDSGSFFKGKIVMVGPAANWTQDTHKTPFDSEMFGPELHLNAINAVLQEEFIYQSSLFKNILLIVVTGLLAWVIVIRFEAPLHRSVAFVVLSVVYLASVWMVYDYGSWMLLVVTPLLTFSTAGAACMIYQFVLESLEKAKTRSKFESYISQNVVKLMLDSPDFEAVLEGVRRPCTILFSDIRGFTTITESWDSHELVSQLNEYFTEMVDCVFQNNGTLDKFIGDAVMAVWGNAASKGPKQDAIDSVSSALQMLTALEKLNAKWSKEGRLDLAIGIGIHHGQVIVGDMGSPKKKEFTVIGDAVNLASRIEGTTKKYGLQLCIGETVAELVNDHFILQKVDLIQVKGKIHPVQTFTVIAPADDPPEETTMCGLELYHDGIDAFLRQEFDQAIDKFKQAQQALNHSHLPKLYIERCQILKETPPPKNWDGVYVLTEK